MRYDNIYYGPEHDADMAAGLAVVSTILLFLLIFGLIAYAVGAWLLSRIFKKAGQPGWIAWIPIYSTWKTLQIGGQQGFWAVLALLPFVNIVSAVFVYIAMYRIGKNLGKEDWFVLLAILLPPAWLIWLAFDDSTWQPEQNDRVTPDDGHHSSPLSTKK